MNIENATARKNTRNPTTIEQFIIERCVRNTRIELFELFILVLACDLVLWHLTFLGFAYGFMTGLIGLIFALIIGIFLFSVWLTIKDSNISSYQIISDQGTWNIVFEGVSVKTRYPVSKVNGNSITMVTPDMATVPKYDETKNIEYEYVKIFESQPIFGYNKMFVSIDGKGFAEKHKTYIEKIRPIGILSIILSVAFCVILIFCIVTAFDSPSLSYLCLGLFFIFIRTIIILVYNNNLHKKLNKEVF
ncbi:hypothetical protein JBL43_16445 [Aureibaculum sp. A20]|uniref:DUF3592 domain-containing protein n=1 Tax=Aureibaculum flavum TaxID=2795986 RepID=A0ABS0WV30_9FLAO|nr:hypothetical protein [Aureibaculum flavum]MBJ2175845.1 hypothetical protein [Aureibaculum flavum]